jgi:hypothetical protein
MKTTELVILEVEIGIPVKAEEDTTLARKGKRQYTGAKILA